MDKKGKRIIIYIVFLVIVFIVTMFITYARLKYRDNENRLYNLLNQDVKVFYKDYYYQTILGDNDEDRKKNAESFKSTGITYTLNELAKYKIGEEDKILSNYKNPQTNTPCDYDKSKVTIYPHEPYGSEDIRIEANIVCGFK